MHALPQGLPLVHVIACVEEPTWAPRRNGTASNNHRASFIRSPELHLTQESYQTRLTKERSPSSTPDAEGSPSEGIVMHEWLQISFRLPRGLLDEVDAFAQTMQPENAWASISRSVAIRFLLCEALRRQREQPAEPEQSP